MPVITQDDIMRKCWDDPDERDCAVCRAYHRRPGGECCFGIKFEDDDETCEECPHAEDCYKQTMNFYARQESRSRVPVKIGSKKINLKKKKKKKDDEIEEERLLEADVVREEDEEDDGTLTLEHTAKRALHGAAEGSLELVLGTLRYRRPPP